MSKPMDDSSQSTGDNVLPEVAAILTTIADRMEDKVKSAKSSIIEDAEKMLDDACNDCITTFQSKMKEIIDSVIKEKPDPSSSTYDEDEKKYTSFVEATARGIEKSKTLFDTIFERIRNIVSNVIECIKTGLDWIWNRLNEAFTAIRSLWTS